MQSPAGHDNCPYTSNPDQWDFNNNGLGFMCDDFEQFVLSGEAAQFASGMWLIRDLITRIPVHPCIADGCPGWLGEDFITVVDIVLPPGFDARIVDDLGTQRAFGASDPAGVSLRFHPRGDAYYEFPGQQDSIIAAHYFLEVIAPEGFNFGDTIPVTIGAHNEP